MIVLQSAVNEATFEVLYNAEADLSMFSMFGRTGAPTKRGPPQARDCRTPARHFLTCGVGPIYAVLRHLKHVSTECFRTLMSENLCEGGAPTFLPNRVRSGLNPALVQCTDND